MGCRFDRIVPIDEAIAQGWELGESAGDDGGDSSAIHRVGGSEGCRRVL